VRKPVKITLSVVIILIFLAVGSMAALILFIDPNDYKSEISAAVNDKIGRDLVLEGELKLTFFPWLGISTGKIQLNNAQGFERVPFATLEEIVIKIKLLPLFAKKIETGGLLLKNVVLNLSRNKAGVNNWDDLTGPNQARVPPSKGAYSDKPSQNDLLQSFAIGGVTIENAQLNWDNQQTGKHLEIKNVNLHTDRFKVNESVAVDLSFMALDTETNRKGTVSLTTSLTVNEKLERMLFSQSELNVITEGFIPGKVFPANLRADIAVGLPNQSVKISGLELKADDFKMTAVINGTDIKDHGVYQGSAKIESFNLARLMKGWGIAAPLMQDSNALTKLAINFDVEATANETAFQNLSIQLDDTQMHGLLRINYSSQPAIVFQLAADVFDADRYLPPVTKKDKPITSPASALALGASSLPIETLRRLNASVELSLQQLKISDLSLQDIHLKLDAKNAKVTTQQAINQFYQGSYSGQFSIDASNSEPALTLQETMNHVQMEPLLKDYAGESKISGIIDATAQLQAQAKRSQLFKSSLNGQLNFHCKDGAIKGFNLQKIIDNGKALVKGSSVAVDPKNDLTRFSDMTGTATVKQGLIQNDDLIVKSSHLNVTGKGSANLNTEQLDYQLTARLIKTVATATEPEKLDDTPVVVHVRGTFSKPTFILDVAALLSEQNKAKIDNILDKNRDKLDKLMNKLDKKLGPGASDLLKRLF